MAFWEHNAHEISKLAKDNIKINVVDSILGRHSFLLEDVAGKGFEIDTLMNLKGKVDKWVDEGKGSCPVRCMATEADTYIPIQPYAIVPGEAPMEGIDLFKNFTGSPDGEHILVITGE